MQRSCIIFAGAIQTLVESVKKEKDGYDVSTIEQGLQTWATTHVSMKETTPDLKLLWAALDASMAQMMYVLQSRITRMFTHT